MYSRCWPPVRPCRWDSFRYFWNSASGTTRATGMPLGTLSVPRAPRRANTNSFARMRTKATIGNGHRQRSATAIGNDRQEPSAATWLRTALRPHEHRPSPRFSSARWRQLNVMEAARSTCTMSSKTGMLFDDIARRCRNGSCSRARSMTLPGDVVMEAVR